MYILSGDIGGTKTFLQLAKLSDNTIDVIDQKRFSSPAYNQFEELVAQFLTDAGDIKIASACFGVAGPVLENEDHQEAHVTNLPWKLNSFTLEKQFKITNVSLINDFQAIGYGLEMLHNDDLVELQQGTPVSKGNQLIIGAGTGLGVAFRVWCQNGYKVIATEGGHIDFSPSNKTQIKISKYLLREYGRTSNEYVLSGSGLVNIFQCISGLQQEVDVEFVNSILASEDAAAAIATAAHPLAQETMKIFTECYGSQAGNYALSLMALGGVYIAGGIAAKNIDHFTTGEFTQCFNDKGKMSKLTLEIPIKVVMNPEVGLLGCQALARDNAIKSTH